MNTIREPFYTADVTNTS